ncbi:hypothetical protein QBC44DRAFT_329989 [Cladorrhinum sp. PSN332]|nr:hypothetical protein QBC44DRAFT_329989 [Cladorrhinum sp. PSN332]
MLINSVITCNILITILLSPKVICQSPPPNMTSPIQLRLPSSYTPTPQTIPLPTLDFLYRTWSVTHSSLPMWRSARNVRITYSPLSPPDNNKINDLVEYESKSPSIFTSGVNRIRGVDTTSNSADTGTWDWRGSGLLFFVTSHWEILGWGERDLDDGSGGKERWVVTWFQKTVFSAEGVDVYSDRKEGLSEGLKGEVLEAVRGLEGELGALAGEDLKEVEIRLPWLE